MTYHKDTQPAAPRKEDRQEIIRDAASYFNFKWPEQLRSGVMFFKGERITRDEFIAAPSQEGNQE